MQQLWNDAIKILIPNILLLVLWYLDKQKNKAQHQLDLQKRKEETKSLVVEQMEKVSEVALKQIDSLRKEREYDQQQIERNRQAAELAQERAQQAESKNDDCEFEHGITRLQLNKVMKKLEMNNWIKSTVFVLDDNKMVTDIFSHRFRTIPVVNFKSYTKWRIFLADVQRERPEIVVVDHAVSSAEDDAEITALDLISQFGYQPDILVMSGTKENAAFYKDTDITFFYKDQWYIRNITKTILEHLIKKNS